MSKKLKTFFGVLVLHLALTENGVEVTALSKETDIRFPLGEDHFLEMGSPA